MWRHILLTGTAALAFAALQAPDNSKTNKRDRHDQAVTPEEQSNKKEDVELTRKIREELNSRDNMSTYAKNVKIVTRDGVTVLRGPVRSTEEKLAVEEIANKHAGAEKVKSYLEVAPEKGKDE